MRRPGGSVLPHPVRSVSSSPRAEGSSYFYGKKRPWVKPYPGPGGGAMPWLLRMATHIYPIDPSPKVRMTRKDTWRNSEVRPAVQRWRAFQNRVQELGITVRDGDHITFRISMP